jgi:AmiR/NasT family two-component response regulator
MTKNFRILLAEDESLVAEMVGGILKELGHTVVGMATDGQQAVAMTEKLRPAVVVMDIKMPDMDGIEAARRIADVCPTPVVVLTAYETPEMIEAATAAGIGAYLTKPPMARDMNRALAISVARFKEMMELRRINAELKEALCTVKTLSGMIPICANCKKVRDDKGCWHQIEEYIRNHSEVEFSHGVCPDCSRQLYPEFVKDK